VATLPGDARRIAKSVQDAGVATWLLRYCVAGWNDPVAPSPVPDARWALAQMDGPVVLLGHSMGARTAIRVADDPNVLGVVALAPWFPPGEPVAALRGKHLVAGHGSADRITSFRATSEYVDRASRVAESAELVDMGRGGHYMFRDAGAWNALAVARCLALLG